MQKGRYLLLSLIALGSIPSSLAQNAETTGDKNAHHIVVPITTKSLAGVVSGDPSKPGAQFVIRMYNDANFIVLPHWHPEDEHVTVVKGTWYLGSGDTFDRNAMRELNVGDYALVPKKMPHFAWSKNDTIILIHGIGPFQQINTDAQQSLSGWTIDPQKGLMRDPQSASYFKFKLNDRVRSDRGEGVIAYGQHSEKNKVTQYTVQRGDGTRFFETEENLRALPSPPKPNSGPLTSTWEGVMTPAISPDGRWIVYASPRENADDNLDVWLRSSSDGAQSRLTATPSHEFDPVFSPDSKRVLYTVAETRPPATFELFRI